MTGLPTGTVTFLFTDIEGSTRLTEVAGAAWPALLENHRAIILHAVEAAGGTVFGTEGDAVFAAFDRPSAGIAASAAAQRALAGHDWGDHPVRVRMGVHTGEALLVADDYVGLEVHRAARIAAAAHGGQILLSEATVAAASEAVGDGLSVRDLGFHRLKDLSRPERIAQLDVAGLTVDFPPIRTLEATPNNLPIQLTSFLGRETELRETQELLARSRLLTLLGPGGTGKTRLALALAAEVADTFTDGVRWVPLEPLSDPALVAPAIAEALETTDPGRPPLERAVAHLEGKRVLLVLDNFEQVAAGATTIGEILRRTTDTKAVVTSRVALAIAGEQLYPVQPLPLPTPEDDAPFATIATSPAVELFVERASAQKPDFRLTPDNSASIARIVRGLDGLPLAIELAAARIRLLPPTAIETRLGDRLALLASTARDLPERQRTIRGAIAWSHDLLTDIEKRVFGRFGVFAGGSAFDEAERICGPSDDLGADVLDGLQGLADQSLLRVGEDPHGDPRFGMFMTIAEFARERLTESGEEPDIRDRHASAYLDLAERLAPMLIGSRRREATDRLADDHDNIRTALDRFLEQGRVEEAERLVAAVWRFWQFRGHLDEGARRIEAVLVASEGRDPGGRPRRSRLRALGAAGGVAYWRGDYATARRAYKEAEERARELGDHAELGEALFNLSFSPAETPTTDPMSMWTEGYADISWQLLDESAAEFAAAGDLAGIGRVRWQQGNVLSIKGEFERAGQLLEEALGYFSRAGDSYWVAWAQHELGGVRLGLGEVDGAEDQFRAALEEFVRADDVSGIGLSLFNFAELAHRRGDEERCWLLIGSGIRLGRQTQALVFDVLDPPKDPRYLIFGLIGQNRERAEEAAAAGLPATEAAAYALGESPR
jgi:predicted ATPase/class 3 adenylate cyclase